MTFATRTENAVLPPLPEPVSPELVLVDPALALEVRSRRPDRDEFPPQPEVRSRRPDRDEFPPQPTGDPRRARPPLRVREEVVPFVAPVPIRAHEASVAAGVGSDGGAGRGRMSTRIVRFASFAVAGMALLVLVFGLIYSRGPSHSPERSAPAAGESRAATAASQAPRTFVWPEEKSADAYEFKLYRAHALVFRARTTAPRLVLPAKWKLAEEGQRLTPGAYRWYVWALAHGRDEPELRAIVQARLVVPNQ